MNHLRNAALTAITTFLVTPVTFAAERPSDVLSHKEFISSSPFLAFPEIAGGDFSIIDGTSTLIRTEKGVAYTANTRELLEGGAYTNWFVAFNKPEQCFDRCACGLDDLVNPFAEVGVFYATGRIADSYGQATFAAQTNYRELPTGVDQVPFDTLNLPVTRRAEVHIVVRTHNDASEDLAVREEQLTEFNGACGEAGCRDVQVSVHRSPVCKRRKK